jgi:hypothetical protein
MQAEITALYVDKIYRLRYDDRTRIVFVIEHEHCTDTVLCWQFGINQHRRFKHTKIEDYVDITRRCLVITKDDAAVNYGPVLTTLPLLQTYYANLGYNGFVQDDVLYVVSL